MDHLVLCEGCNHGATLHAGDGCSLARCRCEATRENIIESALMLAKRDIHDAYRTLAPER